MFMKCNAVKHVLGHFLLWDVFLMFTDTENNNKGCVETVSSDTPQILT